MSSDGGGCLPSFDRDGRVAAHGRGPARTRPPRCSATLLARGQPLERVLPAFTSNPAALLRLAQKGRLAPGADADLVVLDQAGSAGGGDGARPVARTRRGGRWFGGCSKGRPRISLPPMTTTARTR